MLTGWTAAVAVFSQSLPLNMVARVLGVLGLFLGGWVCLSTRRRCALTGYGSTGI